MPCSLWACLNPIWSIMFNRKSFLRNNLMHNEIKTQTFTQIEKQKLILSIMEISSHFDLVKKFSLEELEAAIDYHASQRQIKISEKEVETNGYVVQNLNGELSSIKLEMTKINKAIALLKNKKNIKKQTPHPAPAPTKIDFEIIHNVSNVNNLSDEENRIMIGIQDSRTVPDIVETYTIEQLGKASIYYNNLRLLLVEEKNRNTDSKLIVHYDAELRKVNTVISKINKAKIQLDSLANRKTPEVESTYGFLLSFYRASKLHLDETKLNEISNTAMSSLHQKVNN